MNLRRNNKANSRQSWLLGSWLLLLAWVALGRAQHISEVLFNPPGSDAPNQYLELRGKPNTILSNGTYFVTVNGNAGANPGTVVDIFNLSGRAIGGNGFLLLLQKGNSYLTNQAATILINTNGPGWGSGSTSSIGHRGKSGATDLPHASLTFFLIQSTNTPAMDDDIDPNDNGIPGGAVWAGWKVLDSVGVLDNDGAGDIAYGAINYRRNSAPGNGATASGTVVPVGFTPSYVGRAGNTTGYTALEWVAGDNLQGAAPNWALSDSTTYPSTYDNYSLNHLGGPNFGATPLNGVVAVSPSGGLQLREGGATGYYKLGLNTLPGGPVTLSIAAERPIQVSTDGGATWGATRSLVVSGTSLQSVSTRATNDTVVDTTPAWRAIRHSIAATADPVRYPTNSLCPVVHVAVTRSNFLVLNEIKTSIPGSTEGPWEFVEIRGVPNETLTNVFFLDIESSHSKDTGKTKLVVNLTGARVGSTGLLAIGAAANPYHVPTGTTYVGDARFDDTAGALGDAPRSYLLVSSGGPILEDEDLDGGDNGALEGLPPGTTVLDSVAFSTGDTNDVFYSPAVLSLPPDGPGAGARFATNHAPRTAAAWFFGTLAGTSGDSLVFDAAGVSTNFPGGAVLTPGQTNDIAILIAGVGPLSGVIGDPTNPGLTFNVADLKHPGSALGIGLASTNPLVVPPANLSLVPGQNGLYTLYLDPIGVGFSLITITASNASGFGRISFPYAASAMGTPGGIFFTGASDASAVEAVDANYILVGDDENPIVRLYDRRRSGPPISAIDLRPYLDVTEQNAGEVDIEASTRVGSRLYWTGSHAHNNLAENRTNRMRFFATDIVGSGTNAHLVFLGFYQYFKEDVIAWDHNNLHGKGPDYYGLADSAADAVNPKSPYGFNIEGLSMAPGGTNAAYMGFRAPIVPPTNRTYALIVPVLNFADLAARGGPPGSCVFGSPIELDLYGRGIRSIEGTTNGYVIAAGNPGDGKNNYPLDYKLYTWTGRAEDQPQQRAADLTGLQPEGLADPPPPPWTAETQVQVLSDMGSRVIYNDGVPNKHQPYPAFRKSRGDWIALGPVVPPAPIILSAKFASNTLALEWRALKGLTYTVQFKYGVDDATWVDVPGDVTAMGPYASKQFQVAPAAQAFYRVTVR